MCGVWVWWLTSRRDPTSHHRGVSRRKNTASWLPSTYLVLPQLGQIGFSSSSTPLSPALFFSFFVVLRLPSISHPCNPVSYSVFPIIIFPQWYKIILESSYTARPTLASHIGLVSPRPPVPLALASSFRSGSVPVCPPSPPDMCSLVTSPADRSSRPAPHHVMPCAFPTPVVAPPALSSA